MPSAARMLYEEGTYAEFGVTYTDPHQSGEGADITVLGVPLTFSGDTGDLFDSTGVQRGVEERHQRRAAVLCGALRPALRRRHALRRRPHDLGGPTPFTYDGTLADLNIPTPVHRRPGLRPDANFKLYGGLRAQRLDGDAAQIPFIGPTAGLPGYTVNTDNDWGYGYLVGAAYEPARDRAPGGADLLLGHRARARHDRVRRHRHSGRCRSRPDRDRRRHAAVGDARRPDRRRARARWSSARSAGWTGRSSRIAPPTLRPASPGGRWSTTRTTGGPTTSASGGS